jgi:hypothetical protein
MIKVGDIIDGRKVTRVYELCGGIAYDSVPVKDEPQEEPKPEEKPKRRRKKEQ